MAGRRKVLITLATLAAVTAAAVTGPWVAAVFRGDLWVDTLGYEIGPGESREPGVVWVALDFYGSSGGGTARLEIGSVLAGDRVVAESPAVPSTRRSTFRVSDTRELDTFSTVLSIRPLEAAQGLPRFLVLNGSVEYQRKSGARPEKAVFSLPVDTVPSRRNSVFHRTKLKFVDGG